VNNILNITDLTLTLDGIKLLNTINFNIKQGEIFALVGESGSGKSLTSLAIMRLLSDNILISSGDIELYGKSLFCLSEYEMQKIRGKSIAMIFQEPMSALNPVKTVGEQVAEAIKRHLKLKKNDIKSRVISLFTEVGLLDCEQRYNWYPHQFSGGQKQRVMIAMALACEPDLLIADEPTTALDVTIQAQVLKLLKEIQKKRSLSILFITHDIAIVSQMADRVAVMRGGIILEQANIKEFLLKPRHRYTQKLLQDAFGNNIDRDKKVQTNKIIEIEGLKVYYPIKQGLLQRTVDYVKAVDNVSFSIDKGKTLALVGESGSGKSTIGKAILSLEKLTSGKIIFEDKNISILTQKELIPYRQKIQVVFQDPFSALNPRMTIGNIIREGMLSLKIEPTDPQEQDNYIKDLLLKVELEKEHFYRFPHEFSGGQRQRIGIARALAVRPQLIVCDEPTSALDVSVRSQILKLFKKLQDEDDISYLFITHDLSIVSIVADEVAVMKDGKIVEQGSTEDVMNNPQHIYTKNLLKSAPRIAI